MKLSTILDSIDVVDGDHRYYLRKIVKFKIQFTTSDAKFLVRLSNVLTSFRNSQCPFLTPYTFSTGHAAHYRYSARDYTVFWILVTKNTKVA